MVDPDTLVNGKNYDDRVSQALGELLAYKDNPCQQVLITKHHLEVCYETVEKLQGRLKKSEAVAKACIEVNVVTPMPIAIMEHVHRWLECREKQLA